MGDEFWCILGIMNGSFSSRLPAGKGVSPRGALSARRVGPAGAPDGAAPNVAYITQDECIARGGVYGTDPTGNSEFACVLPPTTRMGVPPTTTETDDCLAKGGHVVADPTGRSEFTCVYPTPVNIPQLPGIRRPVGYGTGGSNTGSSGTGDATGMPPVGTGDTNTSSSGTGDRTGGASPGTGDQNRSTSGTGDRTQTPSGTGDRTFGGFPGTGDRTLGGFPGTGDVFIPGSSAGDHIPREWIQTTCAPRSQMAETCGASFFGAPYHGHPWSGTSFNSQFGGPGTTIRMPGCPPILSVPPSGALRPAGDPIYVTNDPLASVISVGLLALGGYAGWKIGRRLVR